MEPSPKRRKKSHGGESPPQDCMCSNAPREQLCMDVDVKEVTPGFSDLKNQLKYAEMQERGVEETSSGEDAETKFQTEVSMDHISSLPLLVREKIFGFLKAADKVKAAQVCYNWRDTVLHPRHWRHEKVVVNLSQVTEDGLSSVAEREIGSVKICEGEEKKMKYFLERHQSMVSLHLSSLEEANFFLITMSRGQFSSLAELTMTTDWKTCQAFCSQGALRMLSNLRKLSITGRVTNELIQAICGELGRLEELSMIGNTEHIYQQVWRIQGLAQLQFLHTLTLQYAVVEDFSRFCELDKTVRMLSAQWCNLGNDWETDIFKLTSLREVVL